MREREGPGAPVAAIIVVSAGLGAQSALGVALLRVAEILLGAATAYALTLLLPRRRAKTAINGLLGSDVSKELRP